MTGVVFIDTETTGLDPDRHVIWEVALIVDGTHTYQWQFDIGDELDADPFALELSGWYHRRWPLAFEGEPFLEWAKNEAVEELVWGKRDEALPPITSNNQVVLRWCESVRNLIGTRHLVGAVPSFDEERLRRVLLAHGVRPRWHYHLVDVESLAAGYLKEPPPWDSEYLSRRVGVDPEQFDRHTALGDARWAKAIFSAVLS